MRFFNLTLWGCTVRMIAAVLTRNWIAFDHVTADVEAEHAKLDAR